MKTIVFVMMLMGFSVPLWADEAVALIFYYPGGEGTSREAMPLMELFSTALEKKSGVRVHAVYHSERMAPQELFAGRKSFLMLMRLDSYLEWPRSAGKVIARLLTQPLYDDSQQEVYRIYGGKEPGGCEELVLGMDVSKRYVDMLFGPAWQSVKISGTEEPLAVLEEIARTATLAKEGNKKCILLECRQWKALESVAFAWKESLRLVAESAATFSPLVLDWGEFTALEQKLVTALQRFGDSEAEREILTELQLKGFSPLSEKDQSALNAWENRYAENHR